MNMNDKQLLLRDLCSRLPYGVKCNIGEKTPYTLRRIENDKINGQLVDFIETKDSLDMQVYLSECKPYLFPLSSMNEEQYENFIIVSGWDGDYEDIKRGKFSCVGYVGLDYIYDTIDWFNKNHFDYRCLIEKRLAIDCTNLHIY